MKHSILLAFSAAVAFVGCSRQGLVTDPSGKAQQFPIEFSVHGQNMTKGQNLETVDHYNFGVYAYKVNGSNSLAAAKVMENYLVGYSKDTDTEKKGYDHSGATTWNASAGDASDHKSPWFYENLGTAEYTNPKAGFYQTTDTDYMSNNEHQYLRYWDLAYTNTNFYAYAPYVKTVGDYKKVTFAFDANGKGKLTFADNTLRDGYVNPVNSAYAETVKYDRSLSEFMYAGVQATNASLADVYVPFKRLGAMAKIRFYEDIPGYKVEIIDLGEDHGTFPGTITNGDMKKGIQLTPAVASTTTPVAYTLGEYYTTGGATIDFDENAVPATPALVFTTNSTKVSTPLMFAVPTTGLTTYNGHKVIKEKVTTGTNTQEYSGSETEYYAVAQPDSKTGFTMHVSYRIIAEDNQEVITVHNATVHIPYDVTAWKSNTKYTYTFKITKESTGTTNPGGAIDPTDPTPSTTKSLYPIVFDNATIEDFTEVAPETVVSENTNY